MNNFFTLLTVSLLITSSWAAELYVAPNGKEGNAGTKQAPLATLAQARDAIRQLSPFPAAGVTVWIAPGTYPQGSGLVLTAEDSGREGGRVTYRAEQKNSVQLIGTKSIAPEQLTVVKDPAILERLVPEARGQVVQMDLKAADIKNTKAFADYMRNEKGICNVFFAGQRLPLSRWPNGELGYTTMASVLNSGSFKGNDENGGTFVYREDRPARWQKSLEDGGVWLRGFWRVPWVAETLRVKKIDPENKTITFAVSTSNGIGSKYSPLLNGTRSGDGKEPWFVLNLIEEIDQPGEWAIHFPSQTLYLWPPAPIKAGDLQVADEKSPIVTLQEVSRVTLRDLSINGSISDGIRLVGGEENIIGGCHIFNVDGTGIHLRGGTAHQLVGNDINETGLSGIDLLGGERKTLTPGRHQVVNNHLYRTCLLGPLPAIAAGTSPKAEVVGNLFAHNRIHDVPNAGIVYGGNDNILEYNEIYRAAMDSGDVGAFYTTSGWTSRGNILRYNFVHHCENLNGFYMDDGDSGDLVTHNVVYKTDSAGFIGGGHDNFIENNIFIASARPIHADSRGVSRKYTADDKRLRGDLDSVPYQTPPWSEKYPSLVDILKTDPSVPHGNRIRKNLFVACADGPRVSGKPAEVADILLSENETVSDLTIFQNPEQFDFRLKTDAAVLTKLPELATIPFEKIGLKIDEYRTAIPQRDDKLLREGDTKRRKFDSKTDMDASNKKP